MGGAGLCPFWVGAWSPSNTKSPGPSPSSVSSGILIHAAIWPQQIWAENLGALPPPPLRGAGDGSPSNAMWPGAEAYLRVKFHIDPSNRLATVHERHRQTDRHTGVSGKVVAQSIAFRVVSVGYIGRG